MGTSAIILDGPGSIRLGELGLISLESEDVCVEIRYSGISSGTEKLLWSGEMPPFPGMGYPLVPGYESVGEVVEAGRLSGFKPGETVFVPGANCFEGAHGLFGGASRRVITKGSRVSRIDAGHGPEAILIALAATARHAMAGLHNTLPDLIIGHGVLGRLLARLTLAAGGEAPTVWETNPLRRCGAVGYEVIDPAEDAHRSYRSVYDASGAEGILDQVMPHLAKGGEVVLAGFYAQPVQFAYPPAFMKEARLRIAAEWTADDLSATRDLIEANLLTLDGLITHRSEPHCASAAYECAFNDPTCLKMVLDWEGTA